MRNLLPILTLSFSFSLLSDSGAVLAAPSPSPPTASISASNLESYASDYTDSYDAEKIYASIELDDSDGRGDDDVPGWIDPRINGGSMLDLVGNGLREPINVIISGKSDPTILSDAGLRDYVRTIGFSFECLDLHLGGLQRADLGDGSGWLPENFEYRQTQWPGAPGRWVGACWESLYGGNHFRVWKQNGTLANTGAWFFAVSKEKNLRKHHTIDHDGYNVGRDLLVEAALKGGIWKTWQWKAKVEWVDGLLESGRHGINHNISQDGRTAVLTVERVLDGSLTPFPFPHADQSDFQIDLESTQSEPGLETPSFNWNLFQVSTEAISSPIFKIQQKLIRCLRKFNLL